MRVVGIMSGTSLDGLDIALCEFEKFGEEYHYSILKATTVAYTADRKRKLSELKNATAQQYFAMDHLYGKFIANEVKRFLADTEGAQLISSHGHTVFHQPFWGFSTQVGSGPVIAALTGIDTVCDLRSLDVAYGGQGAPLVPIGDRLLFSSYASCLNIGGIANISYEANGERLAYDICFANMALNYLAEKLGRPYDDEGKLARQGRIDPFLLKELQELLSTDRKISLARERYENLLLPILGRHRISIEDKLHTLCVYAAGTIAQILNENGLKKVLVTGGGAYNLFLLEKILEEYKGELVIPDHELIQFKEALIFAFLGYLRVNNTVNTLSSVTGAKIDSIGGALYLSGEKKVS